MTSAFNNRTRLPDAAAARTRRSPAVLDDLQAVLQRNAAYLSGGVEPEADPASLASIRKQRDPSTGRKCFGVIRYAIPHLGTYVVDVENGRSVVARNGSIGDFGTGALLHQCLSAGTGVYMLVDRYTNIGTILCAVPSSQADYASAFCDSVSAGSGVGFYASAHYTEVVRNLADHAGGLLIEGDHPIDALSGDHTVTTLTGVGLHIDSEMAYLRTSEICGLFVFREDGHTRLTGESLEVESAAHRHESGIAVQECYAYTGHYFYPWEAQGLADSTAVMSTRVTPPDAAGTLNTLASVEPAVLDTVGIPRIEEFGGFLGQGQMLVVSSPQGNGVHSVSNPVPRYGLSRQQTLIEGSVLIESARQILIAKAADIPVLRPTTQRDVLLEGQSYVYSGVTAVGPNPVPHNVQSLDGVDIDAATALPEEVYAYLSGWVSLNAAAYSPNIEIDYRPVSSLPANLSNLDQTDTIDPPTPESVQIDHRMTMVDIYRILSFISILPNGDIVIRHGSGSEFKLTGGGVEISGTAVNINAAKTVSVMAHQVSVRGQQDVEIVSSNGDLRLKAEDDLSVLGGNSRRGGVLIESRSAGLVSDWQVDPDLSRGSGIVLKSANSHVSALAGDVIVKTSGGATGLRGGMIVLDSGNQIVSRATTHSRYARDSYYDHFGSSPSNSRTTNVFQTNYNRIGGSLGVDGQLIVAGGIQAESHIVTANGYFGANRQLVTARQGRIGALREDNKVQSQVNDLRVLTREAIAYGREVTISTRKRLESQNQPGHAATIRNTSFGFSSSVRYGASQLRLRQPYWQRKLSSRSTSWVEPVVLYQDRKERETRPWPGQATWTRSDGFIQVNPDEESRYFDAQTSMPKDAKVEDNRKLYEAGDLPSVQRVSLQAGFKTLRVNR